MSDNFFETHGLYAQGSPFFFQRNRITRAKLCEILGNAGAISTTARFKGRKIPIRVWRIAEDFNKPTEPVQVELIPEGEEGDIPKDVPNDF